MDCDKGFSHSKRVLLLAAACNPYKGSEFAVGWHRAIETAKHFDTWAICGDWDRQDISRFLSEHGEVPGLHFRFVERSWFEKLIQLRKPIFEIHYLPHYLWHRRAFKLAARLHRELQFDVTHMASRTGFREPGFLWKLETPFIWGPVGGTQNYPWRFLTSAGFFGALKESLRTIINWLQLRFSPRVRLATKKASCLLAANSQVQRDFERVYRIKAKVLLETGLPDLQPESTERRRPHRPLRLLWSGEFKHHKALHLLLWALSLLPSRIQYELRILGQGPLGRRWQKLAVRLGVQGHCQWLGWLPYEKAIRQYDLADVLVFTSLRDTSGNVVLEALNHGVPVICLDHQGVGDIVTPACGLKIPVTTQKKVILGLRDAIVSLATNEEHLQSLSRMSLERARKYLWSANGAQMASIYLEAMAGTQSR